MNLLFCFMKTDSCPPTRPECSGNYTAHDKMLFTLVAPLVLLAIVLAFAIVRTAIVRAGVFGAGFFWFRRARFRLRGGHGRCRHEASRRTKCHKPTPVLP